MTTGPALIAGALLLVINGFFVAAEFALLASRRSRLEQLVAAGNRRAMRASRSLRELSLMLAGAQLGITMASLGLGVVAEPAVARVIENVLHGTIDLHPGVRHSISFTIALSFVVFLHMVIGEMAPKSWAISDPERSALWLITPFRAFTTVFRPLLRGLNGLANLLVRLVGVTPREEIALARSSAELQVLLQRSVEGGSIDRDAHELLTRSLELSGLLAVDAMTGRRELVAVPADADLEEVERVARESGRSRIVVFEEDLDHVRGVVLVRDVLLLSDAERAAGTAGTLARPVVVTHEHHALEDLLVEMRLRRNQLAVVADEHGLVMGIVTLQDVLDELVGEFSAVDANRRIRPEADGTWLVDAAVRPEELTAVTGLALPEGDWDTVAGFLIAALDRIPQVGDVVRVEDHRVEVLDVDGFAVTEVHVRPAAAPSPGGPDGSGETRASAR